MTNQNRNKPFFFFFSSGAEDAVECVEPYEFVAAIFGALREEGAGDLPAGRWGWGFGASWV
jgi:hypothetical protein